MGAWLGREEDRLGDGVVYRRARRGEPGGRLNDLRSADPRITHPSNAPVGPTPK